MIKTPTERVFEEIGKIFSSRLNKNIRLTAVSDTALKTWEKDWNPVSRRIPPDGGWNWKDFVKDNNKRFRKRYFNIAVWDNEELCGLSLGHISKDNKHVWIDLIEGSPVQNHPLEGHVLKIIIAAAIEYAHIMRKRLLILAEPVSGLIGTYKKLGFEYRNRGFFKKRPVCQKEVRNDRFAKL